MPCNKKWTPIILDLFSEQKTLYDFCNLSLYGIVTRGIATGANNFFALKKSTIEQYKFNDHNICKCITKSSQIQKTIFTDDDFDKLYYTDKPVYCLDVKDHENQEIRKYIAKGEELGYHERYLTKTRNTWYELEYRTPAPILFGVFNRGRFKVIRNFTTALNFTCFHGFYPNIFGEQTLNKLFVYFISDIGQEIIKRNKRFYGNKLDKFEPGDLNNCLCPSPNHFKLIDEEEAAKIIDIAKSDELLAIKMSNNLMNKVINYLL